MGSELTRNGGTLCPDFKAESCTHVVVDDSKSPNVSEIRREIPIVKVEWFWASIQMDACAEEKLHLYSDTASNYLSPSGTMFSPGTPGSTSRKRKRRKEALSQLAANDPPNSRRRSSVRYDFFDF